MALTELPGVTIPGQSGASGSVAALLQKETASILAKTSATVSTYAGDNGERLLNITPPSADNDDARIAYIQLIADDGAFTKDFPQEMKEDRAIMEGLLSELKSKYQKFILTAMGVSSMEKAQIMPTFGDAYAATFTGKEPTILSVTGYLIFDYSGQGQLSWYTAFLNAYNYYLRGSRLAKWRAKLKLILPDLVEYTGYMSNLNTQFSADNDSIVSMSFSYLVAGETIFKSTVDTTASKASKSTLSTAVPNAVGPTLVDGQYVTPNLDTVVDYQDTAFTFDGAATRESAILATANNATLTAQAKTLATTAAGAYGTYLDPKTVMKNEQMKAFTNTLGNTLQNTVSPTVSSASKMLIPKAEEYLKTLSEKNLPMLGAVEAQFKRNVAGLMGNQNVLASNLITYLSKNAVSTSLKYVDYGTTRRTNR